MKQPLNMNNEIKFNLTIAASNTYGYLLATVGPTLVDPLLTSHMAYGSRNYPYAYLIWPIALTTFLLTLLFRRFISNTNIFATLLPLVLCSALSFPIFYPEVPHLNVLGVTIVWCIITTFWLLSRNFLSENSSQTIQNSEAFGSTAIKMPPELIKNKLIFTRNLLVVSLVISCVAMIASFYIGMNFNKELVSVRKELFFLHMNFFSVMLSYMIFIVIGPIQEMFLKYRSLSNALLCENISTSNVSFSSLDEEPNGLSLAKQIDIFISVKNTDDNGDITADMKLAKLVYDYLKEKELRVFLSSVSLENLGAADYRTAIENAIESSSVLIAVAMNPKNLDSRWVRHEWKTFSNNYLSGVSDGKTFVYYDNFVNLNDIPIGLRHTQCIKHSPDGSSLVKLYRFITNSLQQIKYG